MSSNLRCDATGNSHHRRSHNIVGIAIFCVVVSGLANTRHVEGLCAVGQTTDDPQQRQHIRKLGVGEEMPLLLQHRNESNYFSFQDVSVESESRVSLSLSSPLWSSHHRRRGLPARLHLPPTSCSTTVYPAVVKSRVISGQSIQQGCLPKLS